MEEDTQKKTVKPKLGLKRVKKKPSLNISTGNLKSITTPKKFNYLNMSVQKQTLRANNRALAQTLSKTKQDLRNLGEEHQTLKVAYQDLMQEYNRVKKLVGIKDEEIEEEVQRRMQAHIKDLKKTLDDLAQNMLHASSIVGVLNDKCVTLSRRSTASSRTNSLGNTSTVSDRLSFNPRPSVCDVNKRQNSLMMKYLSHADEFSPPPVTGSPQYRASKVNMSVIAEQSFMPEEVEDNRVGIRKISPVSENPQESDVAVILPPQRVLKNTDNIDQETIQKEGQKTLEMMDMDSGLLEMDDSYIQLVSTSPFKSSSDDNNDDVHRKASEKVSDLKGKRQTHVEKSFGKDEKVAKDKKLESASTKVNKTDKSAASTSQKASKISRLASSKTKLSSKDVQKNKAPTRVKSPPTSKVEPSKEVPVDYTSFNPFKPTKVLLRSPLKQPIPDINIQPPTDNHKIDGSAFLASLERRSERQCKMLNLDVETSKSPAASNFADEETVYFNSDMEFTAVLDLGSLSHNSKESSPACPDGGEARISNEKIDASNLLKDIERKRLQKLDEKSRRDGTNPNSGSNNKKETNKKQGDHVEIPKGKEKMKEEKAARSKSSRKIDKEDEVADKASEEVGMVEMRNKKPGVFTFSVGRKEADGTRKPVPEKQSRARSKKTRNVTPEKQERKTGEDRDMFNFGDRTPTVPLEKMLQSNKNVYDMSLNESNIAPASLASFRKDFLKQSEVKETGTDQVDKNPHIYREPLKDSPDRKTELKSKGRSRSKSNTRSKSRSRKVDDSDDDWVPAERRARSRSRRRQERDDVEQDDVNDEVQASSDDKESNVDRGLCERKARSRSKKVKDTNNVVESAESGQATKSSTSEATQGVYHVPLKGSPETKPKTGARRTRSQSRSRSKTRVVSESESEMSQETDATISDREKDSICTETSDNHIYSEPLKDSPDHKQEDKVTKRRARSRSTVRSRSRSTVRSRGKSIVTDSGDEDHLQTSPDHQSEGENNRQSDNGKLGKSKSDENQTSDRQEKVVKSSRKPQIDDDIKMSDRSKSSKMSTSGEKENVNEENAHSKQVKEKLDTDYSTSKNVPDSQREIIEESELSSADEPEHKLVSNKVNKPDKRESNDAVYSVPIKSGADSPDFSKIAKRSRSKRKNYEEEDSCDFEEKVESKSVKKKKNKDAENDSDFEPNLKKVSKSTRKKQESAISKGDENDVESKLSIGNNETLSKIKKSFNFVNSGQRKSEKLNETFELEDDDVSNDTRPSISSEPGSSKHGDKRRTLSTENCKHPTKTPKTLNSRKSLKSSKKTVEKSRVKSKHKDPEADESKERSTVKASRKLMTTEHSETDDSTLSMKTPSVSKSSLSTKSSKSTTTKSQRKRDKQDRAVDDGATPRKKRMNQDHEQKENIPAQESALDRMKKRLTVISSRTTNLDEEDQTETRKKSSIGLSDEGRNSIDNELDEEGGKRSRRNKNQVSYVPKPLNAKIRRGDSLLTTGPKPKVDDMRLLLAKKTGLLKETKKN